MRARYSTMAMVMTALLAGCNGNRPQGTAASMAMFAPASMRIHPIFTQVEDFTGDTRPDGIEAQLEFQDQFGDPTKASGAVLFELFEYRKYSPDPRGKRVAGPWTASLASASQQRDRWNTTLRTYKFQLDDKSISVSQAYVLTAVFESSGGGRFFDRIVLPPKVAPAPPKARMKL